MTQPFVTPIISANELIKIKANEGLILINASAGKDAFENHKLKHLEGALYVDLNIQMADIQADAAHGGRHPLPSPDQFSLTLNELGINNESHVIIYDDKNGSNAAARFWWMLRSAGLYKVQVLDGGFSKAIEAGFPVNSQIVLPSKNKSYNFKKWLLPLIDIQAIDQLILDQNSLIIDVRDHERYSGQFEPIDLVAGHIPGAVNIPFSTNLDRNGLFLAPEVLREKYLKAFENRTPENIIIHCGSGVTACHTLLAIAQAGLQIPKLYVGSWSEWSRNKREIITDQNRG